LYISDRLAAEVFQMIVEGLNNVRRHTRAAAAGVELARRSDYLILRIFNDGVETPTHFMPRSIAERAASLGGRVQVEQATGGSTWVTVEIPL
jgi:signal transduction histidine kinase